MDKNFTFTIAESQKAKSFNGCDAKMGLKFQFSDRFKEGFILGSNGEGEGKLRILT